jgi:CRP/FNR family transcriptional regulator, cyclic AMP receptor protein
MIYPGEFCNACGQASCVLDRTTVIIKGVSGARHGLPRTGHSSQYLDAIAVFRGLPADTLAKIRNRCVWRRYEPGESIIEYSDSSNDVYFITAGEARVGIHSVDGKIVTFCDLGPGEMFGEIAAIDGGPRSTSIEARTSCLIASMSAATFHELLRSEPALAQALLRYFARKVRDLTTRVYEFSALAVNNRIQSEVLRLASLAPRHGKSARIDAAPTHAEIASRASTHREAVTRELNRLSRLGIIEQQGRSLTVKDINRLAALVHEVTGE